VRVTGQHMKLMSRLGCVRCRVGLDGERDSYQSRYGKEFVVCRICHNDECHEATDDLDDEHRERYVKPGTQIGWVQL